MRFQVVLPFADADGRLRMRGDVLEGAHADYVADSPHLAALCVPLADLPAPEEPSSPSPSSEE